MEIVCACGTKMQTLVGCFFGFFFPGMYFWSSREIHCMIQSPWLTVLQKPFWSSKKEAWFSELSKLFNSSRTCDCIHSTWDTERLISKDSCSQPFGNQKSTAVSIVQKKKLNCCALHFLPSLEGKWCCHINKLVCQRKKKTWWALCINLEKVPCQPNSSRSRSKYLQSVSHSRDAGLYAVLHLDASNTAKSPENSRFLSKTQVYFALSRTSRTSTTRQLSSFRLSLC